MQDASEPERPDPAEAPAPRSARRQFAAAILTLEAFVVLFGALVAFGLRVASPEVVWSAGGGLALAMFLVAGMLRRPWAFGVGSALQVPMLAAGLLVPAMWLVGGIFVVLWVVGLRLGGRIDRERAERAAGTVG